MNQSPNKNYFTMPNEIFSLGLDASEIAVYAYLRCLENRRTYQCWPSYLDLSNLHLFKSYFFRVCGNAEMKSLAENVRNNDNYEIIAGHRRQLSAQLAE